MRKSGCVGGQRGRKSERDYMRKNERAKSILKQRDGLKKPANENKPVDGEAKKESTACWSIVG